MLINLHTHLEGRVRPSTAAELARRAGLVEPGQGWETAIRLDGPADLTVYLAKVAATYPFFDTGETLARITREAVEDAAADGQDYLELRFGPATHVRPGFGLDDVIAAACQGLREGVATAGMPAGIVVAALRHHGAELNEDVARGAARRAGDGVVGFDLAGDEALHPDVRVHTGAFALAGAAGLGLTCHAAEAGPASAARQAVEQLGVTRIGHGTHIADDAETMAWAADTGLTVEVCPTSNWYTGATSSLHDHPAPHFRRAGIPVVLGDDNPMQTRSLLSDEYRLLASDLGFDVPALKALDLAAVEAGFMDDGTRAALRRRAAQVVRPAEASARHRP